MVSDVAGKWSPHILPMRDRQLIKIRSCIMKMCRSFCCTFQQWFFFLPLNLVRGGRLKTARQSDIAFWEARTMAINLRWSRFTMAYYLAIRQELVKASPRWAVVKVQPLCFWGGVANEPGGDSLDSNELWKSYTLKKKNRKGREKSSLVSGNFPRSLNVKALPLFSKRSVKSEPQLH